MVVVAEKVCAHFWLIASPDGRPMLPGRCKLCGEKRDDFPVADPSLRDWDGRGSRLQALNKESFTVRAFKRKEVG